MSKPLALLAAACALLAACGDDPGQPNVVEPPPGANDVPADATASPTALVTWMNQQPASDTKEPLRLDGLMPPASETDEPVALR